MGKIKVQFDTEEEHNGFSFHYSDIDLNTHWIALMIEI